MRGLSVTLLALALLLTPIGCSRSPDSAPALPDSLVLATVDEGVPKQGLAPPSRPLPILDPAPPLDLRPGVPHLLAQARPDGGWQVTATPESLAGAADYELSGPTGLYWAQPDRALFRWWREPTFAMVLMELKTGALSTLEGYEEIESGSPGGRYLVLKRESPGPLVLADTHTDRELWHLPEGAYDVTWLSDSAFLVEGAISPQLVDVEAKRVWELSTVAALETELCYYVADKWTVACFRPGEQEGRILLAGDSPLYVDRLVPDPSGRWLAFGYQREEPRTSWHSWGGTAYASKTQGAMHFVDTLVLYDSESGQSKQLALPQRMMVNQLVWSADGGAIGLAVHPGQSVGWDTDYKGDIWLLEVATGRMDRLLTSDKIGQERGGMIMRVEPDGSLLLRGNGLRQLAPGKAPRIWEGELLALYPPGPPWSKEALSGQFALLKDGQVEVYPPTGQRYSWRVIALTPGAYAEPDPSLRWLSIQATAQGRSGTLLFLSRPD